MAFVASALERVAGGAKKLYIYHAAADTIATVTAADYFLTKAAEFDRGDVIIVVGNNFASIDTIFVSSLRNAASVTTISVEGVTAT